MNVHVFGSGSICIHGNESRRQCTFHQKYRGKSHFKENVRDIWTVDSRTIRRDFRSVSNQLGKFSMETVISGQWWRSHQSLACLAKKWIRTQHQILFGCDNWNGSKIHHNTELWTQSTENRWNSRGIFSQGSLRWSLSREVQKFMSKICEPEQLQGRIIFMWMLNDIMWWNKDNETECIANSTLVSLFAKKIFGHGSAIKWYSTDKERPGGKWDRVAELTMIKFGHSGHPRSSRWIDNDPIRVKADTQFSEQRVRSLEERSKAKEVGNYRNTSVPMVIRLKLFFAQLFLLISSVSTEHSQMCVRNTVPVKQVRRDPHWQSNLTHCSRQQTYW